MRTYAELLKLVPKETTSPNKTKRPITEARRLYMKEYGKKHYPKLKAKRAADKKEWGK